MHGNFVNKISANVHCILQGVLTVASNQTLDAETHKVYDLLVVASDSRGQNGRSTTANVSVVC